MSTTHFVATVVGVVLAGHAFAEQGRAVFGVAVTVPARVSLDAIEQPAALELTATDVARGYTDVRVRYRVRHNDRNGYLLEIAVVDRVVRRIEVRGLDGEVVSTDDAVTLRRGGAFEQDLALELRIVLDPATPPGTVALPVRVTATPI